VPKAVVEQWYSRAVQADPGAWGPRLSKLQSLFPKWGGSWPEAEAFANEAARLSPRGSRIFALPLYLMLEQADRSEDEADFLMSPEVQARFEPLARRWLAELPRSIEARRVIAKLKAKAGDHAAAMDLLSECLRIDPVEPKIRFQLGVELYGMKRYAEAETELNKARDLDPKEAGVWYYLGRVAFYGRNDDMAALAAFEKAAALEPWHITYVQYRGIAKVQLRNYHAGIQDLTAVIAKRPTRALAYFHRGRAYWALGREEEAEQDFAQAVRLDPDLARNVQKLKGKNR
jgi:tetratricopeptide (TPR) repeat protein